jgi:hypothetical protein
MSVLARLTISVAVPTALCFRRHGARRVQRLSASGPHDDSRSGLASVFLDALDLRDGTFAAKGMRITRAMFSFQESDSKRIAERPATISVGPSRPRLPGDPAIRHCGGSVHFRAMGQLRYRNALIVGVRGFMCRPVVNGGYSGVVRVKIRVANESHPDHLGQAAHRDSAGL